ncbi:MAG: VTC domain-containing protein [Prolixibacteraceae bacterium]|nr:VTC domain-containing protein [Prolixibacteraceae bacterium]
MLPENYTILNDFRYERKFVGSSLALNKAEVSVKTHPAMFREVYAQRTVNNIYFDTPSLEYFNDNHLGKDQRIKARIRWYGKLTGEINPILELKIKKGLVGIKKSISVNPFIVDEHLNRDKLNRAINNSDIPNDIKEQMSMLEPVLVNRYSRRYFESFDHRYRLTFDSDMAYFHYNRTIQFSNKKTETDKLIIELKYDHRNNNDAQLISNHLPFRLSKNSKYVNGIFLFYPGIAV